MNQQNEKSRKLSLKRQSTFEHSERSQDLETKNTRIRQEASQNTGSKLKQSTGPNSQTINRFSEESELTNQQKQTVKKPISVTYGQMKQLEFDIPKQYPLRKEVVIPFHSLLEHPQPFP